MRGLTTAPQASTTGSSGSRGSGAAGAVGFLDGKGAEWAVQQVRRMLAAHGVHAEGMAGWLSVPYLWVLPEMPEGLSFSDLRRAMLHLIREDAPTDLRICECDGVHHLAPDSFNVPRSPAGAAAGGEGGGDGRLAVGPTAALPDVQVARLRCLRAAERQRRRTVRRRRRAARLAAR